MSSPLSRVMGDFASRLLESGPPVPPPPWRDSWHEARRYCGCGSFLYGVGTTKCYACERKAARRAIVDCVDCGARLAENRRKNIVRCGACMEKRHWQKCRGCGETKRALSTDRQTYCSPKCRTEYSRREKFLDCANTLYGEGSDYEQSRIAAFDKEILSVGTKEPQRRGVKLRG